MNYLDFAYPKIEYIMIVSLAWQSNFPYFYYRELAGPNWHGCNPREDYGAITFRLPGHPFRARGGKKNATLGKLIIVRLFEEMYKLGYDFITSSKLSRTPTDHSTLLFKKVF